MAKLTANDIPLTDPYVYQFIGTGNTSGIFQIESAGMQNLMKQMFFDVSSKIRKLEDEFECTGYNVKYTGSETNPEIIENNKAAFKVALDKFGKELFERIIAAISLYRPGPMDYIPDYLSGMADPKSIKYDTPELEEILSGTYGVIVYQEQVQQIVRKLAGYSLGRGDLIRRAMGKKKVAIMEAEKEVFINGNADNLKEGEAIVPGCVNNGISKDAAIIIWDKMAEFAKYAFNKSHSAGYACITVQTAWLKYYYPIDFETATINSVITKSDKLKFYIADALNMGIKVLSPDINNSEELYTIEGNDIRTGLKGLRNLGKMASPIVEERKRGGKFTSIENFINRMVEDLDKRMLESLIYAGGLDSFGMTRHTLVEAVPKIIEFIKSVKKGQFDEAWFDMEDTDDVWTRLNRIEFEELDEFDKNFCLEKEYEYAGMFISGHPLDLYSEVLKANGAVEVSDILPEESDDEDAEKQESELNGQKVLIAGIIRDLKQIVTKKGDKMYMASLEDKTGTIKIVLFPKVVSFIEEMLADKKLLCFSGTVDDNERGCQIIINSAKEMDEIGFDNIKTLWIDGRGTIDYDLLKDIINKNNGTTTVKVQKKDGVVAYGQGINLDFSTLAKLKENFNVKLR